MLYHTFGKKLNKLIPNLVRNILIKKIKKKFGWKHVRVSGATVEGSIMGVTR